MKSKIINAAVCCAAIALLYSCGIYSSFQKPRYGFEKNAFGQADTLVNESAKILSWREYFSDPDLCALIDSALANNSKMKIAELRLEEAHAALTSAKLAFLPSLSVTPQASWASSDWTVNLPAQASWQVDLFGSLRNAKEQKKAKLRESEAYVQAVRADLIATAASSYYSLISLDSQYEIYARTRDSWAKNVEVTKELMKAGQYTQAAVSQAEANYYSVCGSALAIQNEISSMENKLCSLLGITPRHISRNRFDDYDIPGSSDLSIPADVLSLRPDVKQAENSLAAAFYVTNEARSAFYPSISITGSLDFREMITSAAASLTQPVFQRGSLTANYKTAAAQQKEAESTFRQTLVDAGIEVNNYVREIGVYRSKAEYCDLQVSSLQSAVQSTEMLMKHGSTTYLEVLTAQQSLLTAEIERVSNHLNEACSAISLYQAVGGGSE